MMFTLKDLPYAKHVFEQTPTPALTPETVKQTTVRLHAIRICKGKDVLGNKLYIVQVASRLLMPDNFTSAMMGHFKTYYEAEQHFMYVKQQCLNKYRELKKRANQNQATTE